MYRFDIVIANRNRGELFWEAFDNIKNLDFEKDRLIFMDCSDDSTLELDKCLNAISTLGVKKINFKFIKRRNWNMNQGAILDYVRLVYSNKLQKPRYSFFMQEHYLNKNKLIKEDSIPENMIIDLDKIELSFSEDQKQVAFCSRNGYKISASIPTKEKITALYKLVKEKGWEEGFAGYYNLQHQSDAVEDCLEISGSNFCTDVAYFYDYYKKYKGKFLFGEGTSKGALVWENRICKILYDQNLTFWEMERDIKYKTTKDLKNDFPNPGESWLYFYHQPLIYVFMGRDIYKYPFWNIGMLKYNFIGLLKFIYRLIFCEHNINLKIVYSNCP